MDSLVFPRRRHLDDLCGISRRRCRLRVERGEIEIVNSDVGSHELMEESAEGVLERDQPSLVNVHQTLGSIQRIYDFRLLGRR